MKKFIKVICLLLCMTMTTALFVACAKSDDESQGSTNSGGLQIKLSDYFEEEVYNTDKKIYTTLTQLTDNIDWNTDNIDYDVIMTVKKDFKLLGISFDVKALGDFIEPRWIAFFYNDDAYSIFAAVNKDLQKEKYNLNKGETKSFSYDFTKIYSGYQVLKGYLIEKGSTFKIFFGYQNADIDTIDNIKFTINPA